MSRVVPPTNRADLASPNLLDEGGAAVIQTETRHPDLADAANLIECSRVAWGNNDIVASRDFAERARKHAHTVDEAVVADAILDSVNAADGLVPSRKYKDNEEGLSRKARAEVAYFSAAAAYLRRQYHVAEGTLLIAHPATPTWQARHLLLRAKIAAARDRFEMYVKLTQAAIRLLIQEDPTEEGLIAAGLVMLAAAAREIPLPPEHLDLLTGELPDGASRAQRRSIFCTLGWLRALSADSFSSARYLAKAELLASTPVELLTVSLDRAQVAIVLGDSASFPAHVATLYEFAGTVDWSALRTEDLVALPALARAFAEFGIDNLATKYCQLADKCRDSIAPRHDLAHGTRYQAAIDEALAFASHANRTRTAELASRAYAAFERMGFSWRAARMALLLYGINRTHLWRRRAQEHLSCYPAEARQRVLIFGTATPRQREVLTLFQQGFSDDAIATALGMAPHTVRAHFRNIYRHFNVESRVQLLSKLAAV